MSFQANPSTSPDWDVDQDLPNLRTAHVDYLRPVKTPSVSKKRTKSSDMLQMHIEAAASHFDKDQVDEAVSQLSAAAHKLIEHKQLVHASIDEAIKNLTTKGGRAAHPHPKALTLVRMRKALTS